MNTRNGCSVLRVKPGDELGPLPHRAAHRVGFRTSASGARVFGDCADELGHA